nr:hypothetical protein [Tanacetum cinerariifolium]
MLKKSSYDSWKSRMELYMENRENERMILNSVQNGPLVWPTVVEEDGTIGTKRSSTGFSAAGIQGYYCLQQKLMLPSSRVTTADRVSTAGWIKNEMS